MPQQHLHHFCSQCQPPGLPSASTRPWWAYPLIHFPKKYPVFHWDLTAASQSPDTHVVPVPLITGSLTTPAQGGTSPPEQRIFTHKGWGPRWAVPHLWLWALCARLFVPVAVCPCVPCCASCVPGCVSLCVPVCPCCVPCSARLCVPVCQAVCPVCQATCQAVQCLQIVHSACGTARMEGEPLSVKGLAFTQGALLNGLV